MAFILAEADLIPSVTCLTLVEVVNTDFTGILDDGLQFLRGHSNLTHNFRGDYQVDFLFVIRVVFLVIDVLDHLPDFLMIVK